MGAGFFECLDDPEAAHALLGEARSWLAAQGMSFMRGPLNPSANYTCGLLVDGFDLPPVIMMPWNPPYYAELLEGWHLRKEQDLFAYLIERDRLSPPDWLREEVDRLKAEARFTCRTSSKATLAADIRTMLEIYRESWAKNWGFSPLSDGEAEHHVKELKGILDPDFFVLFYHNDEPAAGMVALPDMNPLLKRLNGKLGLSALWHWWQAREEIRGGYRIMLFGIKGGPPLAGLPLAGCWTICWKKPAANRFSVWVGSWVLEDNAWPWTTLLRIFRAGSPSATAYTAGRSARPGPTNAASSDLKKARSPAARALWAAIICWPCLLAAGAHVTCPTRAASRTGHLPADVPWRGLICARGGAGRSPGRAGCGHPHGGPAVRPGLAGLFRANALAARALVVALADVGGRGSRLRQGLPARFVLVSVWRPPALPTVRPAWRTMPCARLSRLRLVQAVGEQILPGPGGQAGDPASAHYFTAPATRACCPRSRARPGLCREPRSVPRFFPGPPCTRGTGFLAVLLCCSDAGRIPYQRRRPVQHGPFCRATSGAALAVPGCA